MRVTYSFRLQDVSKNSGFYCFPLTVRSQGSCRLVLSLQRVSRTLLPAMAHGLWHLDSLQVIVVLRTWAIWERGKRIGYVLVAVSIGCLVPSLVLQSISFNSAGRRFYSSLTHDPTDIAGVVETNVGGKSRGLR